MKEVTIILRFSILSEQDLSVVKSELSRNKLRLQQNYLHFSIAFPSSISTVSKSTGLFR